MEKGAEDSTSIAAMLVYILDVSGESTLRESLRICRIRKQIIEVTMMLKLTLSETHGTLLRRLSCRRDKRGKAQSNTHIITSTATKGQWLDNEPVHQTNEVTAAPEEVRYISAGSARACHRESQIM
jgi:hypothetical protein